MDGNFVTAKGNAYVEFSVALANRLGLFDSPEEIEGVLDFFKNRKSNDSEVLS